MRRIESRQDDFNDTLTYELDGGRYITIDGRLVREYGLARILEASGVKIDDKSRVPVFQCDKEIGSLPWDFDPRAVRSMSPFYDIRGGDFNRLDGRWIAHPSIGPGDFEAIPGFMWERKAAIAEADAKGEDG